MKRIFYNGLLILFWGTSLVSGSAQASAVQWTLQNVTFDDGGTASGTFTYDADTNLYSAISLTTTGGSILGGASYTGYVTSVPQTSTMLGTTLGTIPATAGYPFLGLRFASGLTNGGGSINLLLGTYAGPPPQGSWETVCVANGVCIGPSAQIRLVTGGSVSAVPIPAAVWLFSAGLGLLGWMKRRQSA